jgi:hypothetical protein
VQELRQQLESHFLTIETLRSESRESLARHENVPVIMIYIFMFLVFVIVGEFSKGLK